MKYYLGIDLGTSGTKIGIINQDLKTVYTDSTSYPLITEGFKSEQKPADWWEVLLQILVKIPTQYKTRIVSLSFSGQMHGMVLVDKQGQVLRNAILWNDTRVFNEVKYLNEKIGKEKLLRWVGNIALEGFTAPKVLWTKKHEPAVFSKIHKILLPKDYLAFMLTGNYTTDLTDASGTLYFDTKSGKWSPEMISVLGITEKQLPELHESNDVVGVVKPNLKSEIGFANDVKVVIGGGDQPVNALSQGVINEGDISIALGTSGVVYAPTNEYKSSMALHSFRSTTSKYCKMGVTLATAGSLQWFADTILKKTDFQYLTSKAKFANKNPILYLPYISGERTPLNDPLVTGCFLGLRREHDERDMAQAIIEGTAFSMKQIYDLVVGDDVNIRNVYISGGGSKNQFWVELIATLIQKEINIFVDESGPFYGAALLAYAGAKNLNPVKLKAMLSIGTRTIKPNEKERDFFNKKYFLWEELFAKTKTISHKLMQLK